MAKWVWYYSCLKLLPKFNQEDVGSFFEAFEAPFSRGKVLCHNCKKSGHIKSSCIALKRKEGKWVAQFATQARVISEDPLVTTPRQPLKAFKGFVSEGGMAITMAPKMAPISILRDTGATQSLLVQGVRPFTCNWLESLYPVKFVGGGFVGVPLQRDFLKSNLVNTLRSNPSID